MPTFYGAVDLSKNELRNAVVQNLGSAPATPSPGQLFYNTATNQLQWWNGTAWISAQGGVIPAAASTVTTLAIAGAAVAGSAGTFSQGDHAHGMPGFAAPTAETTFGASSGTGAAATLPRSDHTHGNPTHLTADHSAVLLSGLGAPTAAVNLNSQKIINLADPTNPQDAASKNYVDATAAGLAWKAPVRLLANTNQALSGLTAIDGVTPVAGDRILCIAQTTAANNGIYVAAAAAWARSADASSAAQLQNMAVFVEQGTTYTETAWVNTSTPPITVGTTALSYVEFAGTGTYKAGNGLTLAAGTFAVNNGLGILSTSTVAIDTGIVARKYYGALNGSASPETITHGLATQDIIVAVRNSSNQFVEVDWNANGVNTVQVSYNPALGAGCRITVVG
jgi:hypothetical protein